MEAEKIHIRIRAMIEIVGKPKDFIESKLKEYIANIKQDTNLMVVSENTQEAIEEKGVWSVISELELVVKGLPNLISFCTDYMPASVEIIKPERFEFDERIFTGFVNDILAKLHETDMLAKKAATENNFLKRNINNLIENTMLISIKLGINTIKEIMTATGLEEPQVKVYLEKLTQEQKIKEENGIYILK